jgi:hypothetical protein
MSVCPVGGSAAEILGCARSTIRTIGSANGSKIQKRCVHSRPESRRRRTATARLGTRTNIPQTSEKLTKADMTHALASNSNWRPFIGRVRVLSAALTNALNRANHQNSGLPARPLNFRILAENGFDSFKECLGDNSPHRGLNPVFH